MKSKIKMAVIISISAFAILAIAAVGYWQRVPLFRYLPSTPDTECFASDEGILMLTKTQRPFSGRQRTEFEERTEIYSYKDGVLNGLNVAYHNGKVKEVGYWKNGEQNGHFQLYSDNGTLLDDAWFVAGQRHGVTRQYHYSTGKLKVEVTFVNGEMDGPCTQYSEAGILTHQGTYKNNTMVGQWFYYYDNGEKKLEATFAEGASMGDAIYWEEDGTQVNGQLDGTGIFYPDDLIPNAPAANSTSEPEITIEEVDGSEWGFAEEDAVLGLTIDNLFYIVPATVQQFLNDGWKMTDQMPFFDDATVLSGFYETVFSNWVTKDGKRIESGGYTIRLFEKNGSLLELTIANQSTDGTEISIEDCTVIGLTAKLGQTTNEVKIDDLPLEEISQEALTALYSMEDDWLINHSESFEGAGLDYTRQQIEKNSTSRIYVEGYFTLEGKPLGIQVYNNAVLLQ